MYSTLLPLHNIVRWLVLIGMIMSLYRAYHGFVSGLSFTKTDNAIRHWTATILHVQFAIGFTLYFVSPLITYFWSRERTRPAPFELSFFSSIHISLMLVAVVLVTAGSAMTKRKTDDAEKFKTMLIWYAVALVIIFIAIPWPFSPFAQRPYIRPF